MNFKSPLLTLLLASLSLAPSALPAQADSVPSLCKSNETAYLNARMSAVVRHSGGGYDLKPLGKYLSICADRSQEPIQKLAYRYGAIGKVEMEQLATPQSPFSLFTRSTGNRTGQNILFFGKSGYTYYVTEALGMGSGIGLVIFQGNKQIAEVFSGNANGTDFESGLFDINFDKASSPVFVKKAPVHKLPG